MFSEIFNTTPAIIGMVHLPPLPGAPGYESDFTKIEERALADAQALATGGVHGLLFENYGDRPFTKDKIKSITVSAMTKVILHCVKQSSLPFGINVLRNDWESALALAAITGGSFIRVNVLSGVYATDQGIIEGEAYSCIRYRKQLEQELGRRILIFADVHTKHGTPLHKQSLEDMALDLVERVGVDGLIVTGDRTGAHTRVEDVELVAKAGDAVPVLLGSGVNPENIKSYSQHANGFIVGTYFKEEGVLERAVDSARVKLLIEGLKEH